MSDIYIIYTYAYMYMCLYIYKSHHPYHFIESHIINSYSVWIQFFTSSGNSYPIQSCDLQVIRNLYSRILFAVFSTSLSEDEAFLQKHWSKIITICKWPKEVKIPLVEGLLRIHYNRIDQEIWFVTHNILR